MAIDVPNVYTRGSIAVVPAGRGFISWGRGAPRTNGNDLAPTDSV